MAVRKLFAILVIAGLLGVQSLATTSAINSTGYNWPFMDYPMYSEPHYRGEVIAQHKIVAVPCAAEAEPRDIGFDDLRLKRFVHHQLLRRLAAPHSADPAARARYSDEQSVLARRQVTTLIAGQLAEPYCRAQVWEQAARLGEPLPADRPLPWTLLFEWETPRATSADSVPWVS